MQPKGRQSWRCHVSLLVKKLRSEAKASGRGWNNDKIALSVVGLSPADNRDAAGSETIAKLSNRLLAELDAAERKLDEKRDNDQDKYRDQYILFPELLILLSGPTEIVYETPDGDRERISYNDANEPQRKSAEKVEKEDEKRRRSRFTTRFHRLKTKNDTLTPLAKRWGDDARAGDLLKYRQEELFSGKEHENVS